MCMGVKVRLELFVTLPVAHWVGEMEGEGEVESVVVAHWVVVPDPEEHREPLKVPLRETVPEEHWEVLLDWVTLEEIEGL